VENPPLFYTCIVLNPTRFVKIFQSKQKKKIKKSIDKNKILQNIREKLKTNCEK